MTSGGTTPTINLVLYDGSVTDKAATFAAFRQSIAGTVTSNMVLIDSAFIADRARLTTLESNSGAWFVPATLNSAPSDYIATVTSMTVATNTMMILSLNTQSAGTVTLNINGGGAKSLVKYNTAGSLVNITGGELMLNKYYFFRYDGTQWVWIDAVVGDQIYIAGTVGNNVKIGSDNTLQDAGAGLSATADIYFSGDISPAQITGNTHNYAPTGFSTASTLRLTTDASRDITGLAGGTDGRIIIIANVGSFNFTLKNESSSSTAGNRFALFADTTVAPNQDVMIQYDSTSSRWRLIGGTGSGSTISFYQDSSASTSLYGALAGSLNDSNVLFTTSQASYISGSLSVYKNGQLLTPGAGNDWVETTPASGTFTLAIAPSSTDVLYAYYQKISSAIVAGDSDLLDGQHGAYYLTEANQVFTDVTTNNASSTKHGYLPKLSNNSTQYLNGAGAFTADDGWISDGNTWSYSSIDSPTGVFSVNADVTGIIQKGTKLKYNQDQALTAYFPMDANSTSTVGSFTSTDVATPTYTAGKFSNALTLNGTTQCVQITDTALMKPTGDFTVGAWIKTSATGAFQIIFSSYSENTNFAGFSFHVASTNVLRAFFGNNTGTGVGTNGIPIVGTTVVTDGNFHYVVLSFKNNYAQIYLDGKLEASGYMLAPVYLVTNYVRIGAISTVSTAGASFFNGQIDDLFLINGYALDEETIKAKYIASTVQGGSDVTVTKKAIITNVGAWSGSATLVTAYHGTDSMLANATVSNPHYSNVKVPFGFNINPDKWSVLGQYSTTVSQASAVQNTWYNIGTITTSAPIGQWDGYYSFKLQTGTLGTFTVQSTLSTANNSESNSRLTSGTTFAAATAFQANWITKIFGITQSTKQTYYLNERTTDTGSPTILLENGTINCVVLLKSSYL